MPGVKHARNRSLADPEATSSIWSPSGVPSEGPEPLRVDERLADARLYICTARNDLSMQDAGMVDVAAVVNATHVC